ncbi:head maturation protease, ClpP-related [Paenibacillus donghaensis]|uniref:ATP-dependent Clp protease proteolytic subunit n=1 Tax=Paenibacillus donghaensis TaxID=414771 RepID=A0A2Z2KG24_9BACL|nr:head maturation protease, ClpP-related [Paenibacillus donghaensis]ASA22090.1 Clp protease ClpP [Paenibacillus donghaensis]
MSKAQQNKAPNKFWEMKMSASDPSSADIFIYGEITKYAWEEYGEVSSTSFKNELNELADGVEVIHLYINSPGGSVFEGLAILNMLQRHKARVISHVDALAASIAAVIAMAGDEIWMPKNSMLMVHHPWMLAVGNATELRKAADDLERIGQSAAQSFLQKGGDKLDEATLNDLLDAETWLSADEAFAYGLCDVVEEANQMAASISEELFAKYRNVPAAISKRTVAPSNKGYTEAERIEMARNAQLELQNLQSYLGGIING